MNIFLYVLFTLIFSFFSSKTQKPQSPDRGNPRHPTVSQSRKIPLAAGRTKVEGPNVMEASPYQTTKNKVKSSSLFGSSSQTVGFAYYQNMEMGICYGEAELYKVYFNEVLGSSPNFTSGSIQSTSISKSELFGDRVTGAGGVSGTIEFIPGDNAGHVSRMEALTGRDQPGCPNLARCIFYAGGTGFYWGNSDRFPPTSYEVGVYFNPFGEATKHKIGNGCNPAYFLYEVMNNGLFGAGLLANIDQTSIQTLADLMVSEGLGFQRTYYDTDVNDIERELLDFMDAVRFRDPTNGAIKYKAIRDDYDLLTIPELDDDSIIKLKIEGPSISTVATKVTVEYLDENKFYDSVKVEAPNVANRVILNRETPVLKQFYGAGNSTTALKLATREALKATKSRKQGKLIATRAAWNFTLGDTIKITKIDEGISDLPVRIINHSKGNLLNGEVVIHWIEEIFSFGVANYGDPTVTITNQIGNPAEVTSYYSTFIPPGPLDVDSESRYLVLGERPSSSASSMGFILEEQVSGAYSPTTDGGYVREALVINTAADRDATTIVLSGSLDTDVFGEYGSPANGVNILIVEASDSGEDEFFTFGSLSYDSGLDETTLTGVYRGLGDTHPQALSVNDKVWVWDYGTYNTLGHSSSALFKMRDYNSQGEFASPTVRSVDRGVARVTRPAPPAKIRIEGSYFPTTAVGVINVNWDNRNNDDYQSTGWVDWVATTTQALPADVTITVRYYNDDTSALLQTNSLLTGESDSYDPGVGSYNVRVELEAVHSTDGTSFYTFSHVFAWSDT